MDSHEQKLQIVYRQVEDLIPYEKNSRTHSEEQIEKVVASIKEFGWTNPILIDEDQGIIAGHGRLEAAKRQQIGSGGWLGRRPAPGRTRLVNAA